MRHWIIVLLFSFLIGGVSASAQSNGKLKVNSEIEGINIKVKTCTADDNDNVILTFTLENTNNFTEDEVYFRESAAKAYDDEGNVYDGEKYIRFARGANQFMSWCPVALPIEVPTKYRMRISNVDPDASLLKEVVIELYQPLHTSERLMGNIYLKNVPITRLGD